MMDLEAGSELHEAFQQLLSKVLPWLLEESKFAAEFLLLYEPPPRVKRERIGAISQNTQRLTKEGSAIINTLLNV